MLMIPIIDDLERLSKKIKVSKGNYRFSSRYEFNSIKA